MNKSASHFTAVLAWMDSLSDPIRVRLLHLLEQHELGVVELCEILQLPQSTVSRHLKLLADAGWVRSRRLATAHLYRTDLNELDPAARKLWLVARGETQEWATLHQDDLRLQRRLRERDIDSAEFFAGAAGEWDKLRGELYGEAFSISAMLALLPAEMVVADLGCGSGPIIEQLAPNVKKIIGVDNSPAMLKAARKRLSKFDNVELKKGDVVDLPIEAASIDAALMLLALTYIADPARAIVEMARILKPGGKAVIVDLLPHDRDDFKRQHGQLHRGFAASQTTNFFTSAGLQDVTLRPLPPEASAKGPGMFIATACR